MERDEEMDTLRLQLAALRARMTNVTDVVNNHTHDLERCAVIMDDYGRLVPTAAEIRVAVKELRAALGVDK